jgi:hypothetical protein
MQEPFKVQVDGLNYKVLWENRYIDMLNSVIAVCDLVFFLAYFLEICMNLIYPHCVVVWVLTDVVVDAGVSEKHTNLHFQSCRCRLPWET